MLHLLWMGAAFLALGFFIILNERYSIEMVDNRRNMVKKAVKENRTVLGRYKLALTIFSIILGTFCIANYIVF